MNHEPLTQFILKKISELKKESDKQNLGGIMHMDDGFVQFNWNSTLPVPHLEFKGLRFVFGNGDCVFIPAEECPFTLNVTVEEKPKVEVVSR